MSSPARSRYRSILILAAMLAGGCATAPGSSDTGPNPREGQILWREDIAQLNARSAWDALRLGGTHLNIQFPREGSSPRVTHRGVDSFILSAEVLLVLDGIHMASIEALRDIRAANLEYIQVLPGRVGVVKYGTAGGNGVVVVKTGVPPSRRGMGS